MGYFSSQIAAYAKANNMSEAQVKALFESMNELRRSQSHYNNDDAAKDFIFDFGDDGVASKEELQQMMCKQANRYDDEFKEDIGIFFDILNQGSDDDVLTEDELKHIKDASGSNETISGFAIWNMFETDDEKDILNEFNSKSADGDKSAAAGEDEKDLPVQQAGNTSGSGVANTEPDEKTSYDFSNINDVKSFLDKFIGEEHQTYGEVLEYLISGNMINEEKAEMIKATLTKSELTAEQQKQVDALVAANEGEMTEEEAMKALGFNTGENTKALDEKRYKEIDYEEWADQLNEAMEGVGTDEAALKSILNDPTITDEQFVQIVKAYEEKYGMGAGKKGLVTRLESETSRDLQTELTSKLGERLINAANNGDEDAINVICKELYSGTAGQMNTANDYLSAIFNNADEETLHKIDINYSIVNKGRDLIKDIKNDHAGLFGWRNWFPHINASGEGQSFIEKIEEARRHH